MEIVQEEKNGIVGVTVKGRMEALLAREFEKTIKAIIASDRKRLLFDLSALDYLRSSVATTNSVESGLKTLSCKLKAA